MDSGGVGGEQETGGRTGAGGVGGERNTDGAVKGADSDRWVMTRLLPPLVIGAMLNPLNSTMLSTALMRLTHAFGRDVSSGALLITPLYITAMIGQPLMGRLADLYSPKRVSYLGLVLVMAAVIVGVLAPSFGWLVVSRVLLGLGTSANYPSAIAILRRYYAERGRVMPSNALGWIAVGGMVSLVLGPMLGGFLTEWWGWQGIFLINIPLVLLVGWLSRVLPDERPVKAGKRKAGASPGLVRLFRERPIVALIYIQSTAAGLVLYLILYGLPQWLEGVKKLSPSVTGLMLLPMSLSAVVSSLLISRRCGPLLTKWLAVICTVAGCASLFALNAGSPIATIIVVSILVGLITGSNPIANQASLNEVAPPELSGISFGLYRTFVYIGAIGSGALLKVIFHKGVTDASFRQICWFSLYSSLIMILLYLPMLIGRRRRAGGVGEEGETAVQT
jgi:MFS family permease